MRKSTSHEILLKEILFGTFSGNTNTRYGIEYEVMTKKQLEKIIGEKIEVASLFVDLNLPFFSAFPDSIVRNDSIVEIKCPISGKFLGPDKGILIKQKLKVVMSQMANYI